MICVHVSYTPLAGAPIRIVNALNKWTDIKARLINLNPNIYGERVFEEDLIWEKDIEEALRLIANADIICFHHWMKLDDNGFKINFLNTAKKNCKFIRQFHSNLDTITGGDKNLKEIILNENIPILSALPRRNFPKNNYSAFPRIVIPHYPERSILNAKIVPNIIPINDENYKPIKQDNDKPTIFYSYTFNNEGFSSRWDTKGYPEVSLLLEQFKDSANIKKITNIPFFECLRIKRNSDIVIDDIITGSYHLTSLEALSQGKTTLAYLDNRTQYILRELTGASELPFVNVKMEEAKYVLEELLQDKKLREEIGDYSRKWMEKYYNDKDLVKIYKKVYEDILNGKDISREYPKNANKWLSIDIEDLIWKARKENYEALHKDKDKEEDKDKNNKFALFKISNDNEYIRLIFFGIKITFKINEEKINKIAWWIPVRKWRDNFRSKIQIDLKTQIKFSNSVILWEPSKYSHGEILTGFAKYLLDLGYEVYIFCNPDRYKEKLFGRFKSRHLHFNKISEAEILDYYYHNQFKKCKLIIITTVRNVLDTKSNYEQKLELFPENIRKKILLVEHDIKAPVDKGFIRDDIITIFKPNYKNTITNVVNPHYFGNIKITSKNKGITKFVVVGEINSYRKNHLQLIEAIEKLHKNKYSNFKYYFIGNNSENINIKPELAQLIIMTGRLNFEDMYNKIEEADYILPLLDPDNNEHNRYITTGTSGSFQLIYGFIKPAIIHKKFSDYYNINDKNAIVYNNNQDLYDKLIYSINIDSNEYKSLQQNLQKLSNSIYKQSINNLKTLINNYKLKELK